MSSWASDLRFHHCIAVEHFSVVVWVLGIRSRGGALRRIVSSMLDWAGWVFFRR